MLLIEDRAGGVVAVRPRLRDRIVAYLREERIDRDLAAGGSPEASTPIALRAQALTSMPNRVDLARGLERALTSTLRPAPMVASRAPIDRASVLGAASDIIELVRRLLADGPVSVRGVAQTQLLLSTADGPLHNRRSPERLPASIHRAICALDI